MSTTALDERKYWISSTELRAAFLADTRTAEGDMSLTKFAPFMRLLGATAKSVTHPFARPVWMPLTKTYETVTAPTGTYWRGVERKGAAEAEPVAAPAVQDECECDACEAAFVS